MKAVIQRVSSASVTVGGKTISHIGNGLMVLLGVGKGDTEEDCSYIVKKLPHLRIFPDNDGVMNLDLLTVEGEILLVSQFTLLAQTKKGNRPTYIDAEEPTRARDLYEKIASELESILGKPVQRGIFGADMQVSLTNEGPTTILIDSKAR